MAAHTAWAFRNTLKRNAFGWRGSTQAITRLNEALTEVTRTARVDPVVAGEGAVLLLERISPAFAHVDSSSGALGAATHDAVLQLVPLIAQAPVGIVTRRKWLDRLQRACHEDGQSLIETLADHWGELCGSGDDGQTLASDWADQLLPHVRAVMRDRRTGTFAVSRSAPLCHSALFRAGRHDELLDLLALDPKPYWHDQVWVARIREARGDIDGAVQFLEGLRSPWAPEAALAEIAERMLIHAGRSEEAYSRFAITATTANTYIARYRAIAKRYPHIEPRRILDDLIRSTPGETGKWFATAETLKQFDLALSLARRSSVDPKTLVRAARDHVASRPDFAQEVALLALHWMARGYAHEITAADVLDARTHARAAAERLGGSSDLDARIVQAVEGGSASAIEVQRLLRR